MVQVNQITAWLDGSNVYGSDEDEATKLRLLGGEESHCSSFLFVSVLELETKVHPKIRRRPD